MCTFVATMSFTSLFYPVSCASSLLKNRRLLAISFSAAVATFAWAYDFREAGIYYDKTSEETVSVTYGSVYGNSYAGDIAIPSSVEHDGTSYCVTGISDWAFFRSLHLNSVAIPESVQRIGNYAFYFCTGLTSVTMDDGVKNIGRFAFQDCVSLRTVALSGSLMNIGISAFQGCSALTDISIPDGVKILRDGLFYGCSALTSVTVPDAVERIDWYVFRYCDSLETLHIGSGVSSIGEGAFYDCPALSSITVDAENAVYDSRDESNAVIETYSNTLLLGCFNTTIPEDVKKISRLAFYGCEELASITIPESITSIGREAFCGSGLRSIAIPENVVSIGKSAFSNCDSLSEISIPSKVESIESCAFSFCSNISSVTCMAEKVPNTSSDAFMGVDCNAATLYVPTTSINRYRVSSPWKSFGTILPIEPSGLEDLPEEKEQETDQPIYDLLGRRLSEKPASGYFIRDGKKYRVK